VADALADLVKGSLELMGCDKMKALIVMAVAAGFMGTMSLAQAGVPAVHSAKASASKVNAQPETRTASLNGGQDQPQNTSQGTSKPTIPGAHEAQSAALSDGAQMAIVGGALLVVGVVFSATSNGNSSHSTTPGTGGTTGSTGTTGTN
jgi:hypothetical protein